MKLIYGSLFGVVVFLGVLLIRPKDNESSHPERINGVSLVNPHSPIDSLDMAEITRINASWVAVIPFAFSRPDEPGVYFNHDRQWWGEKLEGCKDLVALAQSNGFKIMMKPHVWMRGDWIGEFKLSKEEDWQEWEKQYTEYIMAYAKLSQELRVELLCIGTELKQTILLRPTYWEKLIPEIRKVYHGKLTYASNWDNYTQVTFWDQLDYIGVDAYFPLSDVAHPDLDELKISCKKLKSGLKSYSLAQNKPMLFTEYGFRSANGAAGNHWEITRETTVNMDIQVMTYEAFLSTFWEEEWFAGGFLWKWHFHPEAGGLDNNDFTPQNKPVEATIKKWYLNSSL
ncbi:MAG: hypothetical protein CMB80_29065 [Flammeovirgaceae bacterium]|nr:hypothetical protein [Flammeovirgaceae bacterium]HCX23549.1 hypothetical protein [Cytophagales bacterium]